MKTTEPLLNSKYIEMWSELSNITSVSKTNYLSQLRKFDKFLSMAGFKNDVNFEKFYYYEETNEYGPIDEEFIEEYVDYLIDNHTNNVIHLSISALKNFFTFLYDYRLIKMNPTKKVVNRFYNLVRKDNSLSKHECNALLDAAINKDTHSKQYFVLILLLIITGLRSQEVIELKTKDIDIENTLLYINNAKRKKSRVVRITDLLAKELYDYINFFGINHNDYVFFINSKKLTPYSLAKLIKEIKIEANIERHIHPHMFRHTAAKFLIEATNNLNLVRKQFGHTNVSTTLLYLSPQKELYDLLNKNDHCDLFLKR